MTWSPFQIQNPTPPNAIEIMQQGHCLSEITGAIYYDEIKDYTREAA